MIKRTTIELDYELLERAKDVLHCSTARATIHEALRRSIDGAARSEPPERGTAHAVLKDFETMRDNIDVDVLLNNDAWR